MNYFAHGLAHVDRPYYLAGTALPDWLSVVDRKVRVRPKVLEPHATGDATDQAQLAAGAMQHLHDDGWFHSTRGFAEVTSDVADVFRQRLSSSEGVWCGFLGHISTELLIDAALAERYPERLEAYFVALEQVDPMVVEASVEGWTGRKPEQLAWFIGLFRSLQYLRDYADDGRLLVRLNQVLGRVKLTPLPEAATEWLGEARVTVRKRLHELLPSSHFEWPLKASGAA